MARAHLRGRIISFCRGGKEEEGIWSSGSHPGPCLGTSGVVVRSCPCQMAGPRDVAHPPQCPGRVLPLALKTLHQLPRPLLPSPPPHSLCSSHRASLLFLPHARYGAASGPLHRLCPLPECCSPRPLQGSLSLPSGLDSDVAA